MEVLVPCCRLFVSNLRFVISWVSLFLSSVAIDFIDLGFLGILYFFEMLL